MKSLIFKTRIILCSIFLTATFAAAQVTIEDDIVTREIDILSISREPTHNISAAMGMSAVLPGAGHYYIGKPRSAFVYFSIDAASILGAIAFHSFSNARDREARAFAMSAAQIERAPNGDAYWRHVGNFMDAAEYNEAVELSRGNESELYLDPDAWWRWGDEYQQKHYNDLRESSRNMRVASSFFLGAIALNRVISIVDLRVFQRRNLTRGGNTIRAESSAMFLGEDGLRSSFAVVVEF